MTKFWICGKIPWICFYCFAEPRYYLSRIVPKSFLHMLWEKLFSKPVWKLMGTFMLLNDLEWPMTWLQRNELLLLRVIFVISFRYTDSLHDATKGEVFTSCFDKMKTQDTDSSAKTKYKKEKECKTMR